MVDPLTIGVILVGALSAASYYQSRKMQAEADKQAREMASHQISGHDSNRALYTVYGRALVGTTYIYKRVSKRQVPMANANFENYKGGGGTPDTQTKTWGIHRFFYRISSLSNGPINAIENIIIDGETYTASRFTEGHRRHFEAAVSLGPKAGNYFSNLKNNYSTDFHNWDATKKGQGVAYVVERFWFDRSNPAYQGEPQTQYLVKGRSLYDPRKDGTISGQTGTHRDDDETTWEFSDNPALALLDYLTNTEYGRGVSIDELDINSFISSANKCDTLVDIPARLTNTTGSGVNIYDPHLGNYFQVGVGAAYPFYRDGQITTGNNANKQPRFRLNMAVDNSKEVLDNVQQILQSFRGHLHHINGKYVVHMDDVASPVLSLGDDDIIGGLKISQGDRKQRINRMTVKFINANKHYKKDQVSWPELSDASDSQYQTYLTADGGEKLHKTVTVTGCTDYYQAEDIAEYLVRESRATLSVSGKFGSRCFNLVPGDVIDLTYDSAGYSGKYFIVDSVGVDLASMNVSLKLREYDSSVYTWNANRGNEPLGLYFDADPQYNATPTSLTLGTISASQVTLADGTATMSLVVPFTGVPEEATAVEVGWAPTGTTEYTTNVMGDDATKTKFQLGIDDQDVDIRVRYIVTNADGLQMPSGYTTTTFTLPAVSGTRLGGMEDNATANTGALADLDEVDTDQIATGAIGGATVTASKLYYGAGNHKNADTAFYVDDNGNFSIKDKMHFTVDDQNGDKLVVDGDIKAVNLDVQTAQIHGQLTAAEIQAGAVTVSTLAADVYNEFDERYGSSAGFYETDNTQNFEGGTKYVTLSSVTHGSSAIYLECRLSQSWSWNTDYTGNALQANVLFQYKADTAGSSWATVPGFSQTLITAHRTLGQYATFYGHTSNTTHTLAASAISAGDYLFRVKITPVTTPNAWQLSTNGSGTGIPITFSAQESGGLNSVSGNATTLNGLSASSFLRSDANDTLTGNLTITGNLEVQGTQTVINTTQMAVEDPNITLNYHTSNNTHASSNNAGITIQDAVDASTDATMLWHKADSAFDFSHEVRAPALEIGSSNKFSVTSIGKVTAGNYVSATSYRIGTSTVISNAQDLTISGSITANGYNNSNWDAAHSWGDHSAAGYLTSVPAQTFDSLSSKTSGTGDYSTTGDLVSGRGSGGVALTINDGYGNANVTFNHQNGVPEQNGQSARIEVNTDSTTAGTNAVMYFEGSSAPVTNSTAVSLSTMLQLTPGEIFVPAKITHLGDDDTFINFQNDQIKIVAGGNVKFNSNNTYLTSYTVSESDVTAHQGAISITESQISDFGSYAAANHNHNSAYASINHGHSGVYAEANHNHNSTYLALSGGSLTGHLTIGTASDNSRLTFTNKTITSPPTAVAHKTQLIQVAGNGGLWQVTNRGGVMLSSADDALILANGDVGRAYTPGNGGWHPSPENEHIYMLSDFNVYVTTNLQNQGSNLQRTFSFDTNGDFTAPRRLVAGSLDADYYRDESNTAYFIQPVAVGGTGGYYSIKVSGDIKTDTLVELPQITAPNTTTNKLYNVGGTLYFNGTAVGANATAPNAPSITGTSAVNDTIEVVFTASTTSGVDRYEVFSSVDGGDYGLIATITDDDASATMTVVDSTFIDTGVTVAYRVYAVKLGIYSTAATASRTFTTPTLDVTNMTVVPGNTEFLIQWENPASRFVDHIEVYKDAEVTQSNLSRSGATLVYSGDNTHYTYPISSSDMDKFHQFWVEVVER